MSNWKARVSTQHSNKNTLLDGNKIYTEQERWSHMQEIENLHEDPCRFVLETLLSAQANKELSYNLRPIVWSFANLSLEMSPTLHKKDLRKTTLM